MAREDLTLLRELMPEASASVTEFQNPMQSLQASQSTLENYATELLNLQGTDKIKLARLAYRTTRKEFPTAPPDQLANLAVDRFEKTLAARDEEIAKRQTMLREALEEGGGEGYLGIFGTPDQREAISAGKPWKRNPEQARYELAKTLPAERQAAALLMQLDPEERKRYEELLAEELYGRAPEGAIGKVGRVLTAPGRAFAGTVEGLRSQLAEAAPAEPSTEAPGAIRQFLGGVASGVGEAVASTPLGAAIDWAAGGPTSFKDVAGRAAAMAAGGPIGGPIVTYAKRKLLEEKPAEPNVFEALGRGAIAGAASGSAGGVDILEGAKTMLTPGEGGPIALEALKRGGQALLGRSDDPTSAFQGLRQLKEQWIREAYRQAKSEMPPESAPDVVANRAVDLYENRLANDAMGPFIRNPNLAQGTLELIDPVGNVLGGPIGRLATKGIGLGIKGVTKGAGAAIRKASPKAAERLGKLREAFTWDPEARRLEAAKGGMPTGKDYTGVDAANMMRLAEAEGGTAGREFTEAFSNDLAALESLPKEKQALLGDILEGRASRELLQQDPQLLAASRATDRMQQKSLMIKEERRIGRTFKEDPETGEFALAETAARENYMPHRKLSEAGTKAREELLAKEPIQVRSGETLEQATLRARSALERKAPDWWFENSPIEQWTAEVKDLAPRVAKAAEIQNLVRYLDEVGFIKEFDPKKPVIEGVAVGDLQKLMEKQTGVKWVSFDKELAPVIQRVTGKIGEKLGSKNWIVPEPALDRFRQLAPIIGGTRNPTEKAARALIEFNNKTIRPFMHAVRFGMTILGGPVYTANNLVGAFGLGTVAHGIRALNPKLQLPAIAGALASGSLGSKVWRNMRVPLRSGKSVTVGETLDITQRLGLLDQFEMHAGLDIGGKRGIGSKALDIAGEYMTPFYVPTPTKKLGTRNINRMVENYQKLVVFMGFLDDTSDIALARALEKTSQFSGNYRRLSPAEKMIFQDSFTFYNWNRFILPHLTKQIIRNPQRFAAWAKLRGYMEREGEGEAPYGEVAMPDYLAGRGVPAPSKWQPRDIGRMREHDYAAAWMEDPYSMLAGMWGQIIKDPKAWTVNQLSAPAQFMIEMITGRDSKTGEVLSVPAPLNPEDLASSMGLQRTLGQVRGTALAKLLLQPVERMSDNLGTIYKLYYEDRNKPVESMDLQMRYKAMRTFGVLAKAMNAIAGKEVAIGSAIPGVGTSYVRALPTAARQQREKIQRLQSGTYQMGK